ncbi:MAG: hypothetical protein ACI92O_001796 [Colwellia sp.]|jgi:hypothetical protein
MSYDKVITNENGEEFPYSESFDSESYYYKISIVLDDRDGELLISKWGSHIEFDDGSWLDYKIAPNELFPKQRKLTLDNILFYMQTILERESEAKLLTKQEVEKHYKNYLKQLNKF